MKVLTDKILRDNNITHGVDEIFTQVPSWNKYFFSNYGRLIHKSNNGKYTLCKAVVTDNGYINYTLSKPARNYNGEKVRNADGTPKRKRKSIWAHRMVAQMYVVNPYPNAEYTIEDLHVHHKDNNRQNNYYKNLMWLCKSKNGRTDHDFIHSIKKISLYNQDKCTFHTYKDIDLLMKRLDVDVLELIDSLRFNDKLFKSQDGKWDIYQVNNQFIGVQFYKE